MLPVYNLNKIKFATDGPTYERAVKIYESGGVKNFEGTGFGFVAKVRGSSGNFYEVHVSAKHYDVGTCNCYLGEKEILCKHMVALAIYAVMRGEPLSEEDKQSLISPICSGKRGELSKEELATIKKLITEAIRYIKPYRGPSRIWFAYQNSLAEGCNRLTKIVSDLPVSEQTTKLLVDLLLRLDKKLCRGGVDDSDGTVGGFMREVVGILKEYAKLDPACIRVFHKLQNRETCFGWEEPLLDLVKGV